MYISYIIICRIYLRHRVSLTWDLKPIPLDLCSDTCSTELASLTQERSIQSMFTQEVTSKNTKLCLNVGNWAGRTPPKATLYVLYIYFHNYITLFWFQSLDFFCCFTHLFFYHELWSSRILLRDINSSRYNANLKCDLYLKRKTIYH